MHRAEICGVSAAVQGAIAAVVAAVVVVAAAGCAPPPSLRQDLIHDALTRDNRDLALRDPREVMARFARMAAEPGSFFRGSIGVWARDVTTPGGPGALPSAFVDDVAGAILLVGDPHLENLGTVVTDGGLVFGFNDFDVARFGPAVLDLRRLALGTAVAGHQITGGDVLTHVLVTAVVGGYANGMTGEIADIADIADPVDAAVADPGTDDVVESGAELGQIIRDLFDRARSRGAAGRQFDDVTSLEQGQRHLLLAEAAPDDLEAEVLLPVTPFDDDAIRGALREAGFAPRQVARAVGRGVGSRPLLRWLVLLEDGGLLQLKEARDTFALPGLVAEHERFFANNAERVVFARRAMLGHDGADAALRTVGLAPLGAFTTSETAFAQTVRVARLQEGFADGSLVDADLVAFARVAGRALAFAHRRGVSVDGDAIADRLPTALDLASPANRGALVDETLAAVGAGLDNALGDQVLLQELLDTHGPLLGLDTVAIP
jgi:uncharacterized protein (DUF2252 family)